MKQKKISFRLAYYTDAAGKYSPDAVRNGNEDDFFIKEDLADDNAVDKAVQDKTIWLGQLGMLMAVADGMGGMNAGEVASKIAIDTVKEEFSAGAVGKQAFDTNQLREKYLESVIKKADKNIKSEASQNRSYEGMGSTIIMAWLYGNELSVSWCGDSRAYIFNDKSGIRPVSKDHSYVQGLVDKGLLTYEQTFDHPQNNIITRSLGDPSKEAKPESKTVNVGRGDIILLCSDGLSGVLRDRKTTDWTTGQPFPEENLEDIIRAHVGSMKECREALWEAAERGGWYDNVTAILCQITDGPRSEWPPTSTGPGNGRDKRNTIVDVLLSVATLAVVAAIVFLFSLFRRPNGNGDNGGKQNHADSTSIPTDSVGKEDTIKADKENTDSHREREKSEPNAPSSNPNPTITEQFQKGKDTTAHAHGDSLTPINKGKEKEGDVTNRNLTPIKKNKSNLGKRRNQGNSLLAPTDSPKNPKNSTEREEAPKTGGIRDTTLLNK